MRETSYKAIVIGGSAGSFQVLVKILYSLPKDFKYPLLLCMHRLRYIRSGFVEALSIRSNIPVMEPYDKADIKPGIAYLAPANYHMYVESPNHIALSTEEAVNHSRPSIDLTYVSAAEAYRNKLIGIVLSGANRDGAIGMKRIAELGGVTIVQDPNECKARTMPEATLSVTPVTHVYGTEQMIQFLKNI